MERYNCHDLLLKVIQRYQDETIEAYVSMTLQRIEELRNYDPHRISVNNMDTISSSMLPPVPGNVTPVSCCLFVVVVVVIIIYLFMVDWRAGLLCYVRGS